MTPHLGNTVHRGGNRAAHEACNQKDSKSLRSYTLSHKHATDEDKGHDHKYMHCKELGFNIPSLWAYPKPQTCSWWRQKAWPQHEHNNNTKQRTRAYKHDYSRRQTVQQPTIQAQSPRGLQTWLCMEATWAGTRSVTMTGGLQPDLHFDWPAQYISTFCCEPVNLRSETMTGGLQPDM